MKKETLNNSLNNNVNNSSKKKKQKTLRTNEDFHSDVLGSYTGVPEDGERPIQDADDL